MKNYSRLVIVMLSMFAVIALAYAIISGMSVSIGVILAFIVAAFLFTFGWNESDKKTIKVKYFDSTIEPLEKISVGDWIDLRAAETVNLKEGEYRLIRLGVGMALPDGFEALVVPRSSTFKKFGIMLANSVGVIDNSYSGDADEWLFPAVAVRDTVIEKGDRIAQFRLLENQPGFSFEVVSNLKKESRGGLGSTGRR